MTTSQPQSSKTCKGKTGSCGRTFPPDSTLWQCPYCHHTLDEVKK